MGVKPGQIYRYILSIELCGIKDYYKVRFLFDGRINGNGWPITSEAINDIKVFEKHTGWYHVL